MVRKMARGPLSFKQADITRATKAVIAAGVKVARVEVDKAGKIIIIAGEGGSPADDLDAELADFEARHEG